MRLVVLLVVALASACSQAETPPAEIKFTKGPPPPLLPLVPPSATVHVGDSVQFAVKPSADFPYDWWWRSSDTSVATVDSTSGVARARSKGTAVIVARPRTNADVAGAGSITVSP